MSDTDNPLKMLITEFSEAFATWLLGTAVRRVRPLNVEFPAIAAQSDLLFEVTDQTGQLALLHIELQGRRSQEPMPLRVLDYLVRVVRREVGVPGGVNTPRLVSVIIYVGEGAGRGDTGEYQLAGLGDEVTLRWQYRPLRLWEMPAESLFELGNPAFLALIGQTQLSDTAVIMPKALAAIRAIGEEKKQGRLLTALVSLLQTEEVIEMVEKMLEDSETLLLDTPYLRRMREKGWKEGQELGRELGREEGREEGRELGREEGREEGRELGREEGLRTAILEAVVRKFNPPTANYRLLQQYLEQIHKSGDLQEILWLLFDVQEMEPLLNLAQKTAESH